jgi:short-subunit dehydrogenase
LREITPFKAAVMKLLRNTFLAGAAVAAGAAALAVNRRSTSKSIAGKVVVIGGGSRGLGLALAEEFGRHGARLVLAARKGEELEEARRRLLEHCITKSQENVLTVSCDLRSSDTARNLIKQATGQFGRVDVLINVAGVIHVGPVEKQSLEMYEDAMASNFFSMLYTTYAVLPQMLKRRTGAIVNICSIGGKIAVPHLAPYTASKFAAVGFSETLHTELRSKGIRVTTVNPGLMRTGSYPNAIVVGQRENEYRWFKLSASTPGLAHSAPYAARKIYRAVLEGRAEVEIGLDAYLAARFHGIAPTATQVLGSLAERLILPKPEGTEVPAEGTELGSSNTAWKRWSDRLTAEFNQPAG